MTRMGIGENQTLVYGQKEIGYKLFFADRKTIEISVHPDSTVIVKAPGNSNISLIEKKVAKRARWIFKQLKYFQQFSPRTPERSFINGETHLYLGKQYRLKIKKGQENNIRLSRGFFQVNCREAPTPELVRNLMRDWYLKKAKIQFRESLGRNWPKFNSFQINEPIIFIRRMQRRWGSVSKKGNLTLNTELVKAPKECIDYVVVHELCHLKFHDHSPEFYRLLDSVIPGWEKIKHKLELSMA